MATVEEYRERIQQLLEEYIGPKPLSEQVETQLVADTKNDHYQLVNVGWKNERRIYACTIHIDIKDEEVWIQHNMTDQQVAKDLVAAGIPQERIVLGFQPSYMRQPAMLAINNS